MSSNDGLLTDLAQARTRFLALVDELRPELHRYCARMTGSIADGEDVVQDTLARAYYELSQLRELPALRTWLFRIAQHRALDHLRRYDQRMRESLDEVEEIAASIPDAESAIANVEALHEAVSRFVELPPSQRSCVILKDVLGYALDEIAPMLELTVPAVKAALHRGRARLRELPRDEPVLEPMSPVVARYAALFNARDWDGVRAMLVDDVKLDLVGRDRRAGRRDVGVYFTNYDRLADWHLTPARIDGRDAIAVRRDPGNAKPDYMVLLTIVGERVALIRDFRYVPYIAQDLGR